MRLSTSFVLAALASLQSVALAAPSKLSGISAGVSVGIDLPTVVVALPLPTGDILGSINLRRQAEEPVDPTSTETPTVIKIEVPIGGEPIIPSNVPIPPEIIEVAEKLKKVLPPLPGLDIVGIVLQLISGLLGGLTGGNGDGGLPLPIPLPFPLPIDLPLPIDIPGLPLRNN